ncbi:MAG: DNA repair protein RecO [candidate division Zixibacteria bacterium]|nr:DNA repair protein RecO [candidate division Zixibacteria bacterium]
MSICKASALVLKSTNLRESSRIVTLYSKEFGKMKVVAKGMLLPQSRFGGNLENFSEINIVFYKRENTELYTLSQVDLVNPFHKLCLDLDRFAIASTGMELLDKLVSWEEPSPKVFDLSLDFLSQIESIGKSNLKKVLLGYVLKLVTILGYKPKLEDCVACDKKIKDRFIFFSPERGGLVCSSCLIEDGFYIKLTKDSIEKANQLRRITLRSAGRIKMSEMESDEVLAGILDFLDFHIGRGKDLKSMEFFKSINSGGISESER